MSHLAWRGPSDERHLRLHHGKGAGLGGHVGMGAPALTRGPARGSGSDSQQHTQTRMAWHGMEGQAGAQRRRPGGERARGGEGRGGHA